MRARKRQGKRVVRSEVSKPGLSERSEAWAIVRTHCQDRGPKDLQHVDLRHVRPVGNGVRKMQGMPERRGGPIRWMRGPRPRPRPMSDDAMMSEATGNKTLSPLHHLRPV